VITHYKKLKQRIPEQVQGPKEIRKNIHAVNEESVKAQAIGRIKTKITV
jgi:hypothetical protein